MKRYYYYFQGPSILVEDCHQRLLYLVGALVV